MWSLLGVHFKYSSVYVSIPNSLIIPSPHLSPLVTVAETKFYKSFLSGMYNHTFLGPWETYSIDYILVVIYLTLLWDGQGYIFDPLILQVWFITNDICHLFAILY